jgi:Arc/MetJ-type ribon-helix-helix transcriptional regulator
MKGKKRLSASVDASLLRAAEHAVEEDRAPSLSAWVNDALRAKLEQERRLAALTQFVETYEAEHGEITEEEMEAALRGARARAIIVRGRKRRPPEAHTTRREPRLRRSS